MRFEVKIGGKKRPVSFGINQTAVYCEKKDITLDQIGKRFSGKMSLMDFRDLLWSGLYAGAKEEDIEIDFNEWKVGMWVEDMTPTEINDVVSKFAGSMPKEKKGKKKAGRNPSR